MLDTSKIFIYSMAPLEDLYIVYFHLDNVFPCYNSSVLKDVALLIKAPMFLGSVTPSKQTKVILSFFLINSLRIGFSKYYFSNISLM